MNGWQDLNRGLLNFAKHKTQKLCAFLFQRFFFNFPIIILWKQMTPGAANLDPRGMISRIRVGYH